MTYDEVVAMAEETGLPVSNLPIFEHFRHPIFAHKSIKKAAEAAVFNI